MALTEVYELRWVPEISQDSHGAFAALCTEFGLGAAGESEKEARQNLKRTVESFCNALDSRGLLEHAIKESGIRYEIIKRAQEPDEIVLQLAA